MARFTTELRSIVESGFDLNLRDYPIFDENYREKLNNKIIEHYYFREIGFEVAELFSRMLNRRMNEIMPLYNQMYESELIHFDPLITNLMTTISDTVGESNAKTDTTQDSVSNQNTESDLTQAHHDTPMGILTTPLDGKYATTMDASQRLENSNATNNDVGSSNTDSTAKTNEQTTVKGYTGSPSNLINEFRSSFLNIDMLIIDDLQDLFMSLWMN